MAFRLVYIRGTPAQNARALQIIVRRVGGRPHDESHSASTDQSRTISMPFLALRKVVFCDENVDIFRQDGLLLEGKIMKLDLSAFSISIRIVFFL